MEDLRNFHVPLPAEMYTKLREEAEKEKKPATALVREAISQWLQKRSKEALHEAISGYASKFAGSDVDLDESLESATLEILQDQE